MEEISKLAQVGWAGKVNPFAVAQAGREDWMGKVGGGEELVSLTYCFEWTGLETFCGGG